MGRSVVGTVTVVLGTGLVACSSDTGAESSATTSSSTGVCAAADDLRDSLAALRAVQVVDEGGDALATAWTAVEDDWTRFSDEARAEYADQVEGTQAAADTVRSAIDGAQDAPSAQTLGAAASAVEAFVQDADALADEVGEAC